MYLASKRYPLSAPAAPCDVCCVVRQRVVLMQAAVEGGRRRHASRGGEVGDDVGAIVVGLETRERHLVSGNDFLRIAQIGVQRLSIPHEIRLLHRRRIIVTRLGSGLAADNPCKRRSEDILAGLE